MLNLKTINSRDDFLRYLSLAVNKFAGTESFKLEDLVLDKSLLLKYKKDVDKLIDETFFFIEHDNEKGKNFYKKTYRIPEICQRTIQDLKNMNINQYILDFLGKYPLVLHTEFVRWLETKHKSMLSFILDKYWHNFIIYSYEYKSWCLDNVGYFVHHVPTPKYEQTNQESEDIIFEHALFFSEYRKKFPISENILLYNMPYKLLSNSLQFKQIKNIIFDLVSEMVYMPKFRTKKVDDEKINNLLKQTQENLEKNGFYLISNGLDFDEYHIFTSQLGIVINYTKIEIDKTSPRKFNSHRAMPLHTDANDVDIVAWFCQEQDKKDGKIILKSLRCFKKFFTNNEIEVLKTIPIRYPIYKRFYMGEFPLLKNDNFYYAPWLELESYTESQAIILKKFRDFIQNQDEIVIDIQKGDILVIDNTSVLHGRNAISETSNRILYRTHISLPNN